MQCKNNAGLTSSQPSGAALCKAPENFQSYYFPNGLFVSPPSTDSKLTRATLADRVSIRTVGARICDGSATACHIVKKLL